MVVAVILAGGSGRRFGENLPKQFIKVLDKPILAYTLEIFQSNNDIDSIVLVYNQGYLSETKNVVSNYKFDKVTKYVKGGDSYYSSTKNALYELQDNLTDNDIVLIHGACAPLVSSEIIKDVIEKADLHNACASALIDSSGVWEKTTNEYSEKSIYRNQIVYPQFPYGYKYSFILDLYKNRFFNHQDMKMQGSQKDEHIVFDAGHPVYFAKGSSLNFKIDTPADLELFEAYLLMKQQKGENLE